MTYAAYYNPNQFAKLAGSLQVSWKLTVYSIQGLYALVYRGRRYRSLGIHSNGIAQHLLQEIFSSLLSNRFFQG